MSILDLNDGLLVQVLSKLSFANIFRTSRCCKRLWGLVWESEELWYYVLKDFLEEEVVIRQILGLLGSYRLLAKFLVKYSSLEGVWAGDIKPRGQLLRVEFEDGALVGKTYGLSVGPRLGVHRLINRLLFKLEPENHNNELKVTCKWFRQSQDSAGGEQGQGSSDLPDNDAEDAIPEIRSDEFTLIRSAEEDPGEILTNPRNVYVRYISRGELPPERLPRKTTYRRLKYEIQQQSENPSDAEHEDKLKEGMYWALYGLHGPEIILVTYNENSMIEGRKITGDLNVPCGQVSFSVEVDCLRSYQLPPETVAVRQALLQAAGDEITHIHSGVGTVAEEYFRHPRLTVAELLRFRNDNFAVLWLELGNPIFFRPLKLPEYGEVGRRFLESMASGPPFS
ncbi:hypothetical protein NDN08_005223 [Rhodosorus marinus]|uniref:F-box domain-containing protein n=1 Tax=Rhodosorus marinus TaxID=101924 RepID=A0AAV8V1X3_9RHOD|nr:hypothetical protein NDN08_005223 [Rhodosorus marinus]